MKPHVTSGDIQQVQIRSPPPITQKTAEAEVERIGGDCGGAAWQKDRFLLVKSFPSVLRDTAPHQSMWCQIRIPVVKAKGTERGLEVLLMPKRSMMRDHL